MITKDMLTSIEIIIKLKLTIESVPKANERLKVMYCALNGTSNVGCTKEKHVFIIITRGFCVLLDQLECARSNLRCARAHLGLQALVARHLAMLLGLPLTWVCARLRPLVLKHRCARSHYQGTLTSFCLFSTF